MRTPNLAQILEGRTMVYRQRSIAGQLGTGVMEVIDFLSRPMLMGSLHNARHAIKAHENMVAEMERVLEQIPPISPPAVELPEIDLRDQLVLPEYVELDKVLEPVGAAR